MTREEAIAEINALKTAIGLYQSARVDAELPEGFEYPKALKRLLYLKNKLSKLQKKG